MPKVIFNCTQKARYSHKLEMSDADFAAYEAACGRNERDAWFAQFADRFIDPLTWDASYDDPDDVYVEVAKTEPQPTEVGEDGMRHNQVVRSDQAHTKACPSGRRAFSDDYCLGSECMAWRWFETNISDGNGNLVPNGETYGYCGLAGQP